MGLKPEIPVMIARPPKMITISKVKYAWHPQAYFIRRDGGVVKNHGQSLQDHYKCIQQSSFDRFGFVHGIDRGGF
jgi:hypothetical protein